MRTMVWSQRKPVDFLTGRNQDLGEISIDTPVPFLVGVGEGTPGDPAPYTGAIAFRAHRPQACLDVPKAFSIRQLGECHAKELIET